MTRMFKVPEGRCAFCNKYIVDPRIYYGEGGDPTYKVCRVCAPKLNDILTHKELDMENRFDHLEPLELIEKLPFTHQVMFAYGTVYAMDDEKGEGVIPVTSDKESRCDASLVFAHQHFKPYSIQREYVMEKYKILEDHRLGQDKEHLRKKLEETRRECEKIEKRIAELEEKE